MNRQRATQSSPLGSVTRAFVLLAILASEISSAHAQTSSPVEGGPVVPNTEKAEPPQAPAQSPTPEPKDGFAVGGFVFKPGGRIKLDIVRDFDPITSEDSFDPRTIPVDGSEGGNSSIHARETRLFLDVRGPVEGKELRMYVETDFYGSGNVLRLRQAYGSWGGLLAGQTWSTFVDDNNFPNTIDFESPMAFPSFRQAQLRWTQKLSAKVSWSAAIEDNKSQILPPASTPGKAEYPMPDLVTRVRYEHSRGHAFASAFLGKARFRPAVGDTDDATLWGVLLSGRIKTLGKDTAYAQFTFGEGVGRYRGGPTAVPNASGQLHAPALTALTVGYEHFWSQRLSSNVVHSGASTEDEDFYPADFNQQLGYTAINLLYWFLKDRAWAGVEYLHGHREVFGGGEGSADRLQYAVRFNFP
jgi:DcaP outer membrane protein